eukprot:TRINITY_DN10397_c0_g1_i1.p1 TRINITY_DN10397_c0_g1~~TRINITY_DN10397_c0_g1_i1.p1  ORF type:complete len:219 (+),score=40.79 TRINITY_DN10397_c0_g1_i1:44-700(+)
MKDDEFENKQLLVEDISMEETFDQNEDLCHQHGLLIKEGANLLDSSQMETIKKHVDTDNEEFIVLVTKRDFWYVNKWPLIFSIIGSILCVIFTLLIATGKLSFSIYSFSFFAAFPILFVSIIVAYFAKKESFVIITNKKILLMKKEIKEFRYDEIIEINSRINYLYFNREIRVLVKTDAKFHASSISKQAGFKEEFIDGLPPSTRERVEESIKDRVSI